MRSGLTAALLICAALVCALPAHAQGPRADAIWARATTDNITLDGVLDEPAWAAAESKTVNWGVDNGIPGSGQKIISAILGTPFDPVNVTMKFLVKGNQLYIAFINADQSVGGDGGVGSWERFDGYIMGIMDHANASRPAPKSEYFYVWWDPGDTLGIEDPGASPGFFGRWGGTFPRTPEMIAAWDAATVVNGVSNDDSAVDAGWVTEMRMDLAMMGYDVTLPAGDIVEWNVGIYDCDYYWPLDFLKFSASRTWWQDPWGLDTWFDEVRIHARPDVTTASGPAPLIQPELRIPNAAGLAAPVIDGKLNDAVYALAPKIHIKFGDTALRDSYGSPGKYRSGQYQPEVNGGLADVVNPGDADVYYFFREDTLYFGFDVRDRYVQYHALETRWDGFLLSIVDRGAREPDSNLARRGLSFQVGASGELVPRDYLPFLRDTLFGARTGLQLKPGTSVDTLGSGADAGWTAELAVNLRKLGYPAGRGDGAVFLGIDLLDGDSFSTIIDSYGTKTWWFREDKFRCCPAWAYLDPNLSVVDVPLAGGPSASRFALYGNYPNPFRQGTTIRYAMPQASRVALEVYDVRGRLVAKRSLGLQAAGPQQTMLERPAASGLHFYRLRFTDPQTGALAGELSGKMLLLD